MKDEKDTLGLKYEKLVKFYNYDDEKLGMMIKYLIWHFGKDIVIRYTTPNKTKRIIEEMERLELEVAEMVEYDNEFDLILEDLFMQISHSHHSWELLMQNIRKGKEKDKGTTPHQNGTQSDKTQSSTGIPSGTESNTQGDIDGEQLEMEYTYKNEIIATAIYEKKDENKLPWPEQIEDAIESELYTVEQIKKMIEFGNSQEWEYEWNLYMNKIEKSAE